MMKLQQSQLWMLSMTLSITLSHLPLKISAQSTSKGLIGTWYAEDLDQSVIEIRKAADGSYEGIIRSSSKKENIGEKVIYDFRYKKGEDHYEGQIYSVSRDMELDGTIELLSSKKLKITGHMLFLTKTFYWVRRS